jgi:hypothetical protein
MSRAAPKAEDPGAPLSEFNAVLNQVSALTEAITTEWGLLPPESVERHRCEGKLVALHQVIEFFLSIDRQRSELRPTGLLEQCRNNETNRKRHRTRIKPTGI